MRKAMGVLSDVVGEARKSRRLHVIAGIGLSVGAVAGTPVRANTFFGRW